MREGPPHETEVEVHLVQIYLCDECLKGTGRECHTPGCALYLHNSPGHEIAPEFYTVIAPDGEKETQVR